MPKTNSEENGVQMILTHKNKTTASDASQTDCNSKETSSVSGQNELPKCQTTLGAPLYRT